MLYKKTRDERESLNNENQADEQLLRGRAESGSGLCVYTYITGFIPMYSVFVASHETEHETAREGTCVEVPPHHPPPNRYTLLRSSHPI